jgi:hypothetical protein
VEGRGISAEELMIKRKILQGAWKKNLPRRAINKKEDLKRSMEEESLRRFNN